MFIPVEPHLAEDDHAQEWRYSHSLGREAAALRPLKTTTEPRRVTEAASSSARAASLDSKVEWYRNTDGKNGSRGFSRQASCNNEPKD